MMTNKTTVADIDHAKQKLDEARQVHRGGHTSAPRSRS